MLACLQVYIYTLLYTKTKLVQQFLWYFLDHMLMVTIATSLQYVYTISVHHTTCTFAFWRCLILHEIIQH